MDFARLLRETPDKTGPSLTANLKAGFRNGDICPVLADPILFELPGNKPMQDKVKENVATAVLGDTKFQKKPITAKRWKQRNKRILSYGVCDTSMSMATPWIASVWENHFLVFTQYHQPFLLSTCWCTSFPLNESLQSIANHSVKEVRGCKVALLSICLLSYSTARSKRGGPFFFDRNFCLGWGTEVVHKSMES